MSNCRDGANRGGQRCRGPCPLRNRTFLPLSFLLFRPQAPLLLIGFDLGPNSFLGSNLLLTLALLRFHMLQLLLVLEVFFEVLICTTLSGGR